MDEKKFSIQDLVNYIVDSDDYVISFADALDFAEDFAGEHDTTFNKEDAVERWYKRHGWEYAK